MIWNQGANKTNELKKLQDYLSGVTTLGKLPATYISIKIVYSIA